MNRSMHAARWLVLAARFGFAMLLLATTVQAQIAIQDGTPLAALTSLGAGPTVTKSFTVTTGASVLVVIVESRQGATALAEPATITWNGNTLTQVTNSQAATSNYRSMAIYQLFNPPAGTGNISVTYSAAGNTIAITAYTLSGVKTTAAPIIIQTNNSGTVTTLFGTASGVAAGSWAAIGSVWGNTTALTTVPNSVMVASTALGSSSMNAGYVTNLSGTVTIGVTNAGSTKGCFAAAIYTPAPPSAPTISTQPRSQTIFANANGTLKYSVTAVGTAPLSYQWFTNNTTTALSNGGNITGATTNVLTIANATWANAGGYTVVITNFYGAVTSSVAHLTFTSPSGAYEAAVMTNGAPPFAFYSFSETSDPSVGGVVAQDSIGTFSGTYGVASLNSFDSIVGPQTTADGLVGFPDGNTALSTVIGANSYVTLPAFNLNNGVGTNVLTITAWIHPNGQMPNAAGIVFCRGGSTISGLDYLADTSNTLNYNWANDANTYTWSSGLVPPVNVWSLVALVITPTNATIYLCNTNNGLLSSTHVYNHVVQKFDYSTFVGYESYNASRVFNGSIDEVGLFGQALTQSQVAALFSAASGIATFPPTIAANPTWTPASPYAGQTASITVNAGGTAPLSYQWMAGGVWSGIYTNLADGATISGATISGATNATLTITNVQLDNDLDYVVQISNAYGVITSTVPATLTVQSPGPATTYTLNFTGPVQEGIGADWNTANVWNPLGLPASTAVYANPGSSFEVVVGSRLRNPAGTNYNVFPGDSLQVDGDGVFENGTVIGVGEIRFKNSVSSATTNYFKNLVLNGGQLNIGDNTDVILQGGLTVTANSALETIGTGTFQTFRVDSYLTGSGTIQFVLSNSTPAAALVITGNTNTFTGQWNIVQGPLVGSGLNSLGTNTITIGTNGILETSYPVSNTNASLVLNGKMFLTQTDAFNYVIVQGVALTPGTYSASNLCASYPSNFPTTFIALNGTTATNASGQITVLTGVAPTIGANPTWTPALPYVGQTASITVAVAGSTPPFAYQWMAGAVGSGIYTNLADGGSLTGATNVTLTITNVQLYNNLDYVVSVSNIYGAVTSTVPATLMVQSPGPATTYTLNFTGPVQEGAGADWNTVNVWNPLGLSASASMFANPGSSFEVVVGSRLRSPAGSTYNVFPGVSLIVDGSGVMENNTVTAIGEIRFKNSAFSRTTNYFNNLVLNGGQLNIGDSTDVILQGTVTVATNSILQTLAPTGTNETYQVDSYLTGSGTIQLFLSNSNALVSPPLPPASLNITGNTNTFTGQWDIETGPLVGSGANSLGTNTITIGTNGILETSYPVNNTNASLVLKGRMFLTQTDAFNYVFLNGTALTPGTYSAASLSASYPSNFPATFIAPNGTTATNASGQITVLTGVAPTLGANLAWTPASPYIGQTASITVSVAGTTPPFAYQWMAGAVGSGIYTNLVNGGNISGATNVTLTITNVQLYNDLDYVVSVSNIYGAVTSTVPATLTVNDSAPFLVTDTTPTNGATYYAGFTATFTAAFNGSWPIAYQWVTDGGSGTFTNVPGATNSTLVMSNVQAGSAGYYYLIATNHAGGPVSSSPSSLTVTPSTYAIHFGATNAITTADAVFSHPGVVTGAAVFGNTAEVVTLGNGSSLTFTANNSVASVAPGNTGGAFAYPSPNTTGNINLDAVLNQCNYDLGPKTITLNNLVAGHNYSVLLIGLDVRGGLTAGSASARLAYFQDPVVPTDVSSTFHMGDSVYVMASFLARTTTRTIIEQVPTANNGNMNALVVYDLSAVVTPPSSPHITAIQVSGTGLTLSATNGTPGGSWILLQSTNVALPLIQWQTNRTGTFNGSGNLSTNILNIATNTQGFYILKVQ
jgi:hypothetical protein